MNLHRSGAPARSTCLSIAALVAGTFGCVPALQAQTAYPAKPVRLVVGFSAGGPTDVVARAFAEYAGRTLGQSFIVDNKPGANTILAAEAVAAAPADGYTLLLGATNHTMIPALYSARVKFDALRSFAPVCTLANSPTVLVVGPSLPAKTLAILFAVAALAFWFIGAYAPVAFLGHFTVFVLACFVGYMVVWNVTPALHTPLMSVTNAISSIIAIGALIQIAPPLADGMPPPNEWIRWLALFGIVLTAVNMFGGFAVTQRMLAMFRK